VTTSGGGRRFRKTSSSDSSDNVPSPTKPGKHCLWKSAIETKLYRLNSKLFYS